MNICKFGYLVKEKNTLGRDSSSLLPLDILMLWTRSRTTAAVLLRDASPHTEGCKAEFLKDLSPGWHQ